MLMNPDIGQKLDRSATASTTSTALLRKPHKKVKTGCKTCRIRRVKCDEKRPDCQKCTSTGRTCEWYTQNAFDYQYQNQLSSYSKIKSVWFSKALAALPDFGNDMHYLEFYYHRVGPRLSGRFDTEFWSRTILQMAHIAPAVRSALIALGHLYRHQSGTLQHARRCALDTKQYDRRPFWLNYNKAIRLLVEHMSKPSFDAEESLVCCLLFACIEFLQADANVAFTHIRSGLNIVHELRQRRAVRSAGRFAAINEGVMSARSNTVEQVLVPIFTQALASALPYGTSIANDFMFLESCPQYYTGTLFASIDDARSSFFDLQNAAFLIARDMAIKLHESLLFVQSDYERRNNLLKRLLDWLHALEAFESSHTISTADHLPLSTLKMAYYASHSACACIMDETQMSYDAHLDSFRNLIRYATILIDSLQLSPSSEDDPVRASTANFTFDTCVIPALFYLAIRCRCPATRREAIKLLSMDLPREGLWDAEQHRLVAERVVEIEEMEVDANGWPTKTSRLCKSSVGTEVDWRNGFTVSFLYTKDLGQAAQKAWSERLILRDTSNRAIPLRLRNPVIP